jgi:transcriptional regulator with XRE-family HTH domain
VGHKSDCVNKILQILFYSYPYLVPKTSSVMNERERAICARVKQFREDIKWPQEDFSKELAITRNQFANVEYGRAPLRVSLAVNICQIFNANGEWLATGSGLMHGGNPMLSAVIFEPGWYSQLLSDAYDRSPEVFMPPIPAPTYLSSEPTPGFDPQSYLIKNILLWFQNNKFKNSLESENFVREICGYAEVYLNQLRSIGTTTRNIRSEKQLRNSGKDMLYNASASGKLANMRTEAPTWSELKKDIKRLTAQRGEKKALAAICGVSRQVLGNWLSDDSQGTPTAELTLRLLKWVKEQKHPQK